MPVVVRERLISAVLSMRPSDIVHQDVESTPLLLNATDYILHACSRTDIRLYEERNCLPIRQRRACSRCDGSAAQSKTAHHSLSHTLCTAGYENPLALKLICRNGERVCHRHDRISSEAILLLESLKMWSSSIGLPRNWPVSLACTVTLSPHV